MLELDGDTVIISAPIESKRKQRKVINIQPDILKNGEVFNICPHCNTEYRQSAMMQAKIKVGEFIKEFFRKGWAIDSSLTGADRFYWTETPVSERKDIKKTAYVCVECYNTVVNDADRIRPAVVYHRPITAGRMRAESKQIRSEYEVKPEKGGLELTDDNKVLLIKADSIEPIHAASYRAFMLRDKRRARDIDDWADEGEQYANINGNRLGDK